jgi:2-polyprenyl-6-methoxyphenol hydroxylase-like FAD-dependent oxidoreductase
VQRLLTEDRAIRGVRYRDPDGWNEVRAALTVTTGGRFSRVRKLARLRRSRPSAGGSAALVAAVNSRSRADADM